MPPTPLFHPNVKLDKLKGRLGRLTKREASSLSSLKQLVRKQGLSLGLVRGPSEQQDVCLLRFLRAQGFEEKRALASLVSCVEWGASIGLSDLRGHPGGIHSPSNIVPPATEGLAFLDGGCDSQGRPVVVIRMCRINKFLLETSGRRALLRYFVWSVERVLKRVAESMLSSQFIIEDICVVCDAKDWKLAKISNSVLSLLKEAAEVGLASYPERLGQLFLVNLAPSEEMHLSLAARTLGLGDAIDSGRLRVLPGDLPKWAPELLEVIPPESLSVDYGGTAPPLPAPPQQGLPKTIGVAPKDLPKPPPKRSMARRMVSFAAAALSHEGKTSYQIGGRHAFVLVLGLWALVRRSATAAASALWAMAVALAAREWIGVPVTLASATIRVPLVHNPATVLNEQKKKQPESRTKWKTAKTEAAKVQHASSGSNSREEFARLERDRALGLGATGGGDGRGILAWGEGNRGGNSSENAIADANAEYGLSSLSVVGARLEIVDAVGMGQCGFDRFCVKVQVQEPREGGSAAVAKTREWVVWRRLMEFVALRACLMKEKCPRAEGSDRDARIWKLPPVVPFNSLTRRLESYFHRLLETAEVADREQIRAFLAVPSPSVRPVALSSKMLPARLSGGITTTTHGLSDAEAGPVTGSSTKTFSRRQTAPSVLSAMPPRSPQALGATDTSRSREASETSSSAAGGSGGSHGSSNLGVVGGVEVEGDLMVEPGGAREIPSLRPEIRSMFQDPGECHALKLPEREQNQWLRRAHRVSSVATPSTTSPSLSQSLSADTASHGQGNSSSYAGGEVTATGCRDAVSSVLPLTTPPGSPRPAPWRLPIQAREFRAEGRRSLLSSPRRKQSGNSPRKKDRHASPRRREALKRFVHIMRRKGDNGKRCSEMGDSSIFRLLHVDMLQVPRENHLHRVDHIVGLEGGKAQARVKQLTGEKDGGGSMFIFVVNLQLPRSFTKTGWAASVVLYWGVPLDTLSGPFSRSNGDETLSSTIMTGASFDDHIGGSNLPSPSAPPSGMASTGGWGSGGRGCRTSMCEEIPPFERELLMRYVDLPFNRLNQNGPSGFGAEEGVPGDGIEAAQHNSSHGATGKAPGGSGGLGEGAIGRGAVLSGFNTVDDDESESGVLLENDFRNMSFKVVTSVVEGRYNVRKAVDEGSPQALSRKLTQRYFRGSLYMETDVDVGSSLAAECVVGVCLKEPCTLDVGFFLEGSKRVLGCVRVRGIDLALAEPLLPPSPTVRTVQGLNSVFPHTGGMNASTALPTPLPGGTSANRASRSVKGGSGFSMSGAVVGGRLGEPVPLGNPQFSETFEDNGETHSFRVRGPGYMIGGGKVDAGEPFGRLVRADLFKMDPGVDRMDNIGSVGRAAKVVRRLQKDGEFLFIVNLQVPGNPPLSMVLYYAVPVPPGGVPTEGAGGRSEGFLELFRRFVDLGPLNNADEADAGVFEDEGLGEAGGGGRLPGDDLRNLRFKLLPSILEGPWIVRKAVGSKPTLIAQKLTCRYFRTRSYFEADIDIGSSVVAYNTVSLAIGYAKSLVVDMGFCIQGEKEDELPEVLLGVARLRRLDVLLADPLEATETIEDSEAGDDDDHTEVDEDECTDGVQQGVRSVQALEKMSRDNDYLSAERGHDLDAGTGLDQHVDSFLMVPSSGAMATGPSPLTSQGLKGIFSDSRDSHSLRVRGSSYLTDRRKISAGPAFGTLLRADFFSVDGNRHHLFRVDHIASRGRMRERVAALLSAPDRPFLFIVNIQIPGDQAYSVVLCWGLKLREVEEAISGGTASQEDANFLHLFQRYINLDLEGGLPTNDIRNRRLKMFPKVLQGPWVVRKAVGSPCIIGRKLTARYFRRPDYFEVDIDVGSSALATYATHLAGRYAKNIVLNLAFGLQGESEGELPERLIGSAHIVEPDLECAEQLDD